LGSAERPEGYLCSRMVAFWAGTAGNIPLADMNRRASMSVPNSRCTTMACRVPCLVKPFVSKLEDRIHEGVIDGTIGRPENSKYDVLIGLTKRMDLPEHWILGDRLSINLEPEARIKIPVGLANVEHAHSRLPHNVERHASGNKSRKLRFSGIRDDNDGM